MLIVTVWAFFILNNVVDTSKILCILPIPMYSHYAGANQIMLELVERGHEVTVISPFPAKFMHANYRNITISIETIVQDKSISLYKELRTSTHKYLNILFNFGFHITETIFKDENFRRLMESDEHFDAVIMGQIFTDSFQVLCQKYNASCIIYNPLFSNNFIEYKIANPGPLSYVSDFFVHYSDQMTFFQRVFNCFIYWYSHFLAHTIVYPKQEELIKKYFNIDVKMKDLFKKTSLVLRNSHLALNGAVPTVPNLVEIGGFHLRSPKELNKELKKYLDDAKDGVIYFNMGSILKSSLMPKNKLQCLLKVLGRINMKVLFKYENDSMIGVPENVKTVKWAPQIDVLAHPNVKLFITHGGAFSTIEAINFKVPMVGIPIFSDQDSNMKFCESREFARIISFEEMDEHNVFEAINDILTQPKYAENIKLHSQILQDSPITQMEKAIYYIEYVMRYNGAPQLKVPAMEFPLYKEHSLDVVLFIFFVTFMLLYIIYKCIRHFFKKQFHEKIE